MAPRVFYIGILRIAPNPVKELAVEKDLSSYSRFTRENYGNIMSCGAVIVAERTGSGQRKTVEERDHTVHAYASSQGICGIIITDHDYPKIMAHNLLSKMNDEFTSAHPQSEYADTIVGHLDYPQLKEYIVKWQNPVELDSFMKIQRELDETKIILHKTIESVLERGENIDKLVERSDELSASSKMFYTQARKQNSCCTLM